MCLIVDYEKTETFSKRYVENTQLIWYKSFWFDAPSEILRTLFKNVSINKTLDFISEPIEHLNISIDNNGRRIIESGCLHCFIKHQNSNTIVYKNVINELYFEKCYYISLPIIVNSDDVISLGRFNSLESAVVSRYKIPKSSWDLVNKFKT
jgi:hypothetical protein